MIILTILSFRYRELLVSASQLIQRLDLQGNHALRRITRKIDDSLGNELEHLLTGCKIKVTSRYRHS